MNKPYPKPGYYAVPDVQLNTIDLERKEVAYVVRWIWTALFLSPGVTPYLCQVHSKRYDKVGFHVPVHLHLFLAICVKRVVLCWNWQASDSHHGCLWKAPGSSGHVSIGHLTMAILIKWIRKHGRNALAGTSSSALITRRRTISQNLALHQVWCRWV